jgi:hypothetical protein
MDVKSPKAKAEGDKSRRYNQNNARSLEVALAETRFGDRYRDEKEE